MFDFNLSNVKMGIQARFESDKKPFYGYTLEKVKGGYLVKYQSFGRVWEDMNYHPVFLKGTHTKQELIDTLNWIDWRWQQDFQVYSLEFDGSVFLSWGDCIQHAIDNLVSHAPHLFKHTSPSTLERIKVRTA
jgi:hypothetical protein